MRLTLMLSALLMLAGCAGTDTRQTQTQTQTDTLAAAQAAADAASTAAACAADGGQMQRLGRLQREQCVVAYADAGKTCSAKSDCTGQCLAQGDTEIAPGTKVTGICQRDVSENFGCRQRIDGGVAQGTICVD